MSAPAVTFDKSLAQLSPGTLDAIKVYILQAIVNGETVPTNAQELLEAAKCYVACLPAGVLGAIQIYLLTQIANGGGGGGGASIVCLDGSDAPVDAPESTCAIAYNEAGQVWTWNANGPAWNPILM